MNVVQSCRRINEEEMWKKLLLVKPTIEFPHLCQNMSFERQVTVEDDPKFFFTDDMLKHPYQANIGMYSRALPSVSTLHL